MMDIVGAIADRLDVNIFEARTIARRFEDSPYTAWHDISPDAVPDLNAEREASLYEAQARILSEGGI